MWRRQKTIKGGDSNRFVSHASVITAPQTTHVHHTLVTLLDLPICRSNDWLSFRTFSLIFCTWKQVQVCCHLLWLICAYFTGSELAWTPEIICGYQNNSNNRLARHGDWDCEKLSYTTRGAVDEQIRVGLVVCYHWAHQGNAWPYSFIANHFDCVLESIVNRFVLVKSIRIIAYSRTPPTDMTWQSTTRSVTSWTTNTLCFNYSLSHL